MSEIFVARIFLETAPKPYLGVTFRYKVCLILVNDAGGRGLLSYWGRRRREGRPPPQKPSVSAVAPVYSTWTLNMSHRSVTKESHWFTTILSGPELLKPECTWNTTGGPIKM